MFENGTFAVLGPDGKQVQCDVLFTYDCEDNGRSYVVFTTGEGAQQQLFANRYAARGKITCQARNVPHRQRLERIGHALASPSCAAACSASFALSSSKQCLMI